uniref:Uncharacterized protein n=1 Tax=Anguilla anguilla TaxID=7936 RepID=A0A0E9URW9_ANGAN
MHIGIACTATFRDFSYLVSLK